MSGQTMEGLTYALRRSLAALRDIDARADELLAAGTYEPTLFAVLVNHDWWHVPVSDLLRLIDRGDRTRWRAAGAPVPETGSLRLYRGVGGSGEQRWIRGLWWTEQPMIAAGLALKTRLPDPGVYVADMPVSAIFARCERPAGSEWLVDPRADYTATLVEPFPAGGHVLDGVRRVQHTARAAGNALRLLFC